MNDRLTRVRKIMLMLLNYSGDVSSRESGETQILRPFWKCNFKSQLFVQESRHTWSTVSYRKKFNQISLPYYVATKHGESSVRLHFKRAELRTRAFCTNYAAITIGSPHTLELKWFRSSRFCTYRTPSPTVSPLTVHLLPYIPADLRMSAARTAAWARGRTARTALTHAPSPARPDAADSWTENIEIR